LTIIRPQKVSNSTRLWLFHCCFLRNKAKSGKLVVLGIGLSFFGIDPR